MSSPASIIDPTDADHLLSWPRHVVAAELDRRLRLATTTRGRRQGWVWEQSVSRLLRAAFEGPGVAEEFDALGGGGFGFNDNISEQQVAWARRLRAEIDAALMAPEAKPYWSARRGATPPVLSLADTAERFVNLVAKLNDRDGLWTEAFGVDGPDGHGDPVEPPRHQFEDLLGRELGNGMGWPLGSAAARAWTRDNLFDLMEVLHDLASWPGMWSGHDFGGCIGHPGDFSPACGRALYLYEMNRLLERSDLGVRLAETGEDQGLIVQHDGEHLSEAVDEALQTAPPSHLDDVRHAVALFRQRDRDVTTMRSAIVTLAGVVEAHRELLKEELLRPDEGALFNIANNFDLRHRKPDQRTDYDPAFLEWIFHWYLATVSLIRRLADRDDITSPGSPVVTDELRWEPEEPF
jgi:hypothetical protein